MPAWIEYHPTSVIAGLQGVGGRSFGQGLTLVAGDPYLANVQDPVRLGGRVRELRLQADLSVERLAALAGISGGTLSRIERGETKGAQFATLSKVARALGFASLDDLLAGRQGTTSPPNVTGYLPDLRPLEALLLPVYRWGACGDPRDQESAPDPTDRDYPPLGKERLIGSNGFAVQVRGESMANRQIHDGDTVWINPDRPVRLGRPVLARIWDVDGSEVGMVVKVLKRDEGGERLWGDGDGDHGTNPVICSRYELIGPVVWVEPAGFPPN